jgi:hypothetical protein
MRSEKMSGPYETTAINPSNPAPSPATNTLVNDAENFVVDETEKVLGPTNTAAAETLVKDFGPAILNAIENLHLHIGLPLPASFVASAKNLRAVL